jgi:hypothetical protein
MIFLSQSIAVPWPWKYNGQTQRMTKSADRKNEWMYAGFTFPPVMVARMLVLPVAAEVLKTRYVPVRPKSRLKLKRSPVSGS